MKKIIIAIITIACFFTGCEKFDQWGDGRSDLEHTYIVMMDHPEHNSYFYTYQIDADGASRWRNNSGAAAGAWIPTDEQYVASIPVRLYSERVRSYDVVTYIWLWDDNSENVSFTPLIPNSLTAGTDYVVTLENGTVIQQAANGGYPITWPQAKKGIQNIKIKRTAGSPAGRLLVNTFKGPVSPKEVPTVSVIESFVNNETSEYAVRININEVNKRRVIFN